MNPALPTALIININNFAAKKLALDLLKKDINVVGVGDYFGELCDYGNFSVVEDVDGAEGKYNYIFDINGNGENIFKENLIGEKYILICIDDAKKADSAKRLLNKADKNWRMIETYGVYGPEMEEIGFLSQALRLAALNKNLILPSLSLSFRILSVDDLVEAVLRASFLSGTEKEIFLVVGDETNSEVIAKVLIDEAKMTRLKVIQNEVQMNFWEPREVEESRRKLRWQPKITFKQGIKETLQYFFSKVDEENRTKIKQIPPKKKEISPIIEKTKKEQTANKRTFEVVVEEEEANIVELDREYKKEEIVVEPPLVEKKIPNKLDFSEKNEQKLWEIKKINTEQPRKKPAFQINNLSPSIRNSNLRPVVKNEETTEEKQIKTTEERLLELNIQRPKEVSEPKTETYKTNNNKRSKNRKITGYFFILLLIVLLTPIIITPIEWGIVSFGTVKDIQNAETLIKEKKYNEANELTGKTLKRVKNIDQKIDDWGLNRQTFFRNYQTSLKVAEDVLLIENKSINLARSGETLNNALFHDKEADWRRELKVMENGINDISNDIGVLQARLTGDWSWLPVKFRSYQQKGVIQLDSLKQNLNTGSKAIKLAPEMLGLDGRRRDYLILLQNEMELRAGGGFIGSYAILSFQNGRLLGFDIKDVYDTDGQLKGHVEPPEEIRKYLGEGNWYMRDANWSPNFPNSAADIQWFFEKETGRKVDGIFGINLAVAKEILGVIGEVYVPDFKEKINKDNLYEQAEFYSESKFFPGSNQKASFLGGLGKQMFEEIRNLKPEKALLMMQSLINLLDKNEIQMAFNNQEAAKIVDDLEWNGAINHSKCATDNCINDYLYIVESNLGVNKANYFLYRNIEQTVDIATNSVSRILKINYENTAKSSSWPGGDYKNYLRIYLPEDVNLAEISVISGNDLGTKKIYSEEELKIKNMYNKKEIGFLVTVPISQKRTVEVRYSSGANIESSDKFSYINYIQRQSGFGDTGLVSLISFPAQWQPVQVQPMASIVNSKLLFNQKLDKDIKMGVEFSK